MRDLREAMKQGPRATFNSATHLPRRHPLTFALALGGLAAFLLIFGYTDTRHDINDLRPKVVEVERANKADPCVSLSQAVKAGADRKKITHLTARCVSFLNALGDLISHGLACDILKAGGIICHPAIRPAPDARRERGDAPQPANAGQPPAPAPAGDKKGTRHGSESPATPPTPPPSSPASSPPPPSPASPNGQGSAYGRGEGTGNDQNGTPGASANAEVNLPGISVGVGGDCAKRNALGVCVGP